MEFRQFVENYEEDIKKTLAKLPTKHRKMVNGYKFKFQSGNTLNGDDDHIGITDEEKKEITVAAPYFYGREFTVLHEVGHFVWKKLTDELHKKWEQIVKSTKMPKKDRQNPEELFCHAYATFYTKRPPNDYCYDTWHNFVKKIS